MRALSQPDQEYMNRRVKNTLITLAFPVAMFLIMEAVCLLVMGKHVIDFSTNLDLVNLGATQVSPVPLPTLFPLT